MVVAHFVPPSQCGPRDGGALGAWEPGKHTHTQISQSTLRCSRRRCRHCSLPFAPSSHKRAIAARLRTLNLTILSRSIRSCNPRVDRVGQRWMIKRVCACRDADTCGGESRILVVEKCATFMMPSIRRHACVCCKWKYTTHRRQN